MSEAGADPAVSEDALRMISLVSCSTNGNAAPPEARTSPELLWPRWELNLEPNNMKIGFPQKERGPDSNGEKILKKSL